MIARTAIWACGGDAGHAIVALIYTIFAQCNREDSESLIVVQKNFPWFKQGKNNIPKNVTKDMKKLFHYFHFLEKASARFPDLVKECIELGKKAIELKDTLDKDLKNADEYQKTRAVKSIPHNIKMLERPPTLVQDTMKNIEMILDQRERINEQSLNDPPTISQPRESRESLKPIVSKEEELLIRLDFGSSSHFC